MVYLHDKGLISLDNLIEIKIAQDPFDEDKTILIFYYHGGETTTVDMPSEISASIALRTIQRLINDSI